MDNISDNTDGYVPPEEPPEDAHMTADPAQLFSEEYLDTLEPPENAPDTGPLRANVGNLEENAKVSFSKESKASIRDSIKSALAAVLNSGMAVDQAASLLRHAEDSLQPAFFVLGHEGSTIMSAIHHAMVQMGDQESGKVWIGSLKLSSDPSLSKEVQDLFIELQEIKDHPQDASGELSAASALARKLRTAQLAWDLTESITESKSPDAVLEKHSALVSAPPISVKEAGVSAENQSAEEVLSDDLGISRHSIAISSGFRTLDATLHTRPEFPMGFTRSGQVTTISARTGSGKTSCMNTLLPAAAADMASQGIEGRILYVQVEDDLSDVLVNMGFGPGRKYNKYAKHIAPLKAATIADMTKHFYREVLRARRLSEETGTSLVAYMPPALYLDHISALHGQGNDSDVEASRKAADLLLHGFANCDPEVCHILSGLRYEDFTGEAWPQDDLDSYELGVVTTVQTLIKGAGATEPYDPVKHRSEWRKYALADPNDEPSWEPLPGDMPLSDPQAVRGHTKILDNTQLLMFLHRPRVQANVVAVDALTPCGHPTLEDNRGYFQILKARFGQKDGVQIVPMEFNLQRNGGTKAQYFDPVAEIQIASGVITPEDYNDEVWQQSGDPIIPVRPVKSKSSMVLY